MWRRRFRAHSKWRFTPTSSQVETFAADIGARSIHGSPPRIGANARWEWGRHASSGLLAGQFPRFTPQACGVRGLTRLFYHRVALGRPAEQVACRRRRPCGAALYHFQLG